MVRISVALDSRRRKSLLFRFAARISAKPNTLGRTPFFLALIFTIVFALLATSNPVPGQVRTGYSAVLLSYKATITVTTDASIPSPLLAGTFSVSTYNEQIVNGRDPRSGRPMPGIIAVLPKDPPLRAFFDANGNGRVDVCGTNNPGIYPRFLNNQGLQSGSSYFGRGQNVIVIAQFSTWTTVNRPQFIALHLQTDVKYGAEITQASIRSANLFAGDLFSNPPAAGGGNMAGMVLASTNDRPIQLAIQRRQFGFAGQADGNVVFVDSIGQVFGARISFNFTVPVFQDTTSTMNNNLGNAVEVNTVLPGP
jgi:hypothetical protein